MPIPASAPITVRPPEAHDDTAVLLQCATRLIAGADALLIGAGAGMSADSGIPVYRGPHGRYTSPAVLAEANADTFTLDPLRAAEACRRRYADVLAATPHDGYDILNRWRVRLMHGAFVYTSNIDSMFTRIRFPESTVYEVHGALARSQCLAPCDGAVPIFPTPSPEQGVAMCPACGDVARPNTLMFGDYAFHDAYRERQWQNFARWSDALPDAARVVILEIGAGTDVATVRNKCESLSAGCGWPLIRINPHEPVVPEHCAPDSVAIPLSALDALRVLDRRLVHP